ncbi:MAG: FAD-dependent oxidoreductase, partial [Chloroflexi bacterium]|nr:FAD-dependent oxidoreductase [Chloroflexota bacterium]
IYPVPDPAFPFLGVHFTRRLDGSVEAGPNAVLALKREGYRWRDIALRDATESLTWPGFLRLARDHWQTGLGEVWRSANKSAFVRALQRLMPNLEPDQLVRGGAGVRAQALRRDGSLADDFEIAHQDRLIHILNAPSPGATASLLIGEEIASTAESAWLGG